MRSLRLGLLSTLAAYSAKGLAPIVVSVCENKSCRKDGAASTVQIFRDLVGTELGVSVCSVGCIGQCGKGPNVRCETKEKAGKVYCAVKSAATAAAILSIEFGIEVPDAVVDAALLTSKAKEKGWSPKAVVRMHGEALELVQVCSPPLAPFIACFRHDSCLVALPTTARAWTHGKIFHRSWQAFTSLGAKQRRLTFARRAVMR